MATEYSAERFEFARVKGRSVVAGFDGGTITADAGALLLPVATTVDLLVHPGFAQTMVAHHLAVSIVGLPILRERPGRAFFATSFLGGV